MQNAQKRYGRRMRITAILMVFALLLFLLISTYFISHEAEHDCTGDDCPVCALIQLSESNLRQLGSGAPAAAVSVTLMVFILVMQIITDDSIISSTPVSRKTRLNN